jgi:hypothetical protein
MAHRGPRHAARMARPTAHATPDPARMAGHAAHGPRAADPGPRGTQRGARPTGRMGRGRGQRARCAGP